MANYILDSKGNLVLEKKKKAPVKKKELNPLVKIPISIANAGAEAGKEIINRADDVIDTTFQVFSSKLNPFMYIGGDVENKQRAAQDVIKNTDAQKFIDKNLGWGNKLSNGKTVQETVDDNSYIKSTNLGGQVSRAVGGMLPQMMLGGYAGAKAATALIGATSFGSGVEQAYKEGATRTQTNMYGLGNAAIEVATEWITGGVPGVKSKWFSGLDNIVAKGIGKKSLEEVSKNITQSLLQTGYKIVGEGFEEGLAEILNPLLQNATYTKDKKINWDNVINSAIVGAISGGILNAPSSVADFKAAKQNKTNIAPNISPSTKTKENAKTSVETPKNELQLINNVLPNREATNKKVANVNETVEPVKITNTKINNFRKSASKFWKDTQESRALGSVIEKIIEDKNYNVLLDNKIKNPAGNPVNAQIKTLKNGEVEIRINPESKRAGEFLLTHEITHAIQTEEMGNLIIDYAKKNTGFNEAVESLKKQYGTEDINPEVIADISGQLLGNQEFLNNLSMENPNTFKVIYNKIIELLNKITGNSNEKLFLLDLKNKFETAYRTQQNNLKGVQYNTNENIRMMNIDEIDFQSDLLKNTIYDVAQGRVNLFADILSSKEGKLGFDYNDVSAPIKIKNVDGKWRAFDGNHRLAAYKQLGIKEVPTILYEKPKQDFVFNSKGEVVSEYDSNGKKLPKAVVEFFKDSVVRDEQGRLLVVYHGSQNKGFTVFDKQKMSSTSFSFYGKGFYFTTSKLDAKIYGNYNEENIYKVYLNITNSYEANDSDAGKLDTTILKSKGYDGVKLQSGKNKIFVAFEPNQIKLTTNEKPTENEDIRYSMGEEINNDLEKYIFDDEFYNQYKYEDKTPIKESIDELKKLKQQDNLDWETNFNVNEKIKALENGYKSLYDYYVGSAKNRVISEYNYTDRYKKQIEEKKKQIAKKKQLEKEIDEATPFKKAQYELIQKTNPAPETNYVWIRSPKDIKTFDEVINDEESFSWGDFSKKDAELVLKRNRVTIYSSYPIKKGVFVSTSRIQAEQYAGGVGSRVYSKQVIPSSVAWINGDEGQYAKVSKTLLAPIKNEEDNIQGLENYTRSEIKDIARNHIENIINENGEDFEIVGIDIHGSRGRKTAKKLSDLDIVVEYKGSMREDDAFNMLNDTPFKIDGIKVDINPITATKTGTLSEYMKTSNEYDKQILTKSNTLIAPVKNDILLPKGDNMSYVEKYKNDNLISLSRTTKELKQQIYDAKRYENNDIKAKQLETELNYVKQLIAVKDNIPIQNKTNIVSIKEIPDITKNDIDNAIGNIFKSLKEDFNYGKYVELDDLDYEIEQTERYIKAKEMVNYWEENGIDYNDNFLNDTFNEIYDKFAEELKKEGYYNYYIEGKDKTIISNKKGVEKGYNEVLDYLDNNNVKYDISRSTEAGLVPSIYIKDSNGDVVLRIGNHFNREMSGIEKTFNSYDYINWQDKIKKYIDENIETAYDSEDKQKRLKELKSIDVSKMGIMERSAIGTEILALEKGFNSVEEFKKAMEEKRNVALEESKKEKKERLKIYEQQKQEEENRGYKMKHRPSTEYGNASNFETNMAGVFEHPEWYFNTKEKYNMESLNALQKVRNNPEAEMTIYRATPGNEINIGDWVTPSKKYAEFHNESQFDGKANILEMKVKAKDVVFGGDDINEFGYSPSNENTIFSQENGKWQEHLEKNYMQQGTTTMLPTIKKQTIEDMIPKKQVAKSVFTEEDLKQTKIKRKEKIKEYREEAKAMIANIFNWKDKKIGLFYATNTMERNIRDIVKDKYEADRIIKTYFSNITKNNARIEKEINVYNERIKRLNLNEKESIAVQMLGEYKYNPETDLHNERVYGYIENNKLDMTKLTNAVEEFRVLFDELIVRINDTLKSQGYKEIPYRKGYFPHFIEDKPTSIIGKMAKALGWKFTKDELPTDIAGITEQFRPGKTWFRHSMRRTGKETDYNVLKGFDNYIRGAMDIIHHTEDIQKLRALENEIRYEYSDKGIQEEIDLIQKDENLTVDEKQEEIDKIYEKIANPMPNLVTHLRTYTNNLANKKYVGDRNMEYMVGRQTYNTLNNIHSRLSANMIGLNIRSALTNFIPITQMVSQVGSKNTLKSIKSTMQSFYRKDNISEQSVFLTNRRNKADYLYKTKLDKVTEKAFIIFDVIDDITSNAVVRGKYYENIDKGMDHTQALENADEFAKKLIGGRDKGSQPTIFNQKSPVMKLFTAFQLETSNQFGYMFKDLPDDLKDEGLKRLIAAYMKMFFAAWLYNKLFKAATGSKVAFSPIDIIEDVSDITTNKNLNDRDKVLKTTERISKEVPFAGSLIGGGRLPINAAIPDLGKVAISGMTLINDDDEGKRKTAANNLAKELTKPVIYLVSPFGAGQIKKSIEGLSMFSKEIPGSYSPSGDMRYPVENTTGNKIQAALFGQYANKNANVYFDNSFSPMGQKQIKEYSDLKIPYEEYAQYRKDLSKAKKVEEKFDYISNLPYSNKQKNIMINNAINRNDKVDVSTYKNYSSLEEYDFATNNPTKYNMIKQIASYNKFKNYESEMDNVVSKYNNTNQRKTAIINYVNDLPLSVGQKAIMIKMRYPSIDSYNNQIVQYINKQSISMKEKTELLTNLGFKVINGRVSW